ncbi:MAG: L,D-transpeptidase family protein [Sphingomonadaceae bacterium]
MSDLLVDVARQRMQLPGGQVPCAIGRAGALPAAAKREGDGATPLGRWPLLAALLRPDRGIVPPHGLPWRWLRPDDGWCDAPEDPAYNRPVTLPHRASAERLWREDEAYDAIVVLGHNLAPVVPGLGSAIFWHVACTDPSASNSLRATEGCLAIPRSAMLAVLPHLRFGMHLDIGPTA